MTTKQNNYKPNMLIHIEFTSKNDGKGYMLEFESIEEYLKYSKTFTGVAASVSLYENYVSIKLKDPIYHKGDFKNTGSHYHSHELVAMPGIKPSNTR